jgi:hypothetical protein
VAGYVSDYLVGRALLSQVRDHRFTRLIRIWRGLFTTVIGKRFLVGDERS